MESDLFQIGLPLLILLLLIAAQVPVAFALGAAGLVGIFGIVGPETAENVLSSVPYGTVAVYSLSLIPMFIVMGLLLSHSGMLDGMFNIAQRATHRLPGGLGMGTVAAATFMGGISGSSVADAATLGRLSINEMSKRGYDKAYAAAIVAAANTVAVLIPPSIVLVLYGVVAGESIGKLLLAGIVPGIITSVVYASMIYWLSRGRPDRGGRLPSADGTPSKPAPVQLADWLGFAAGGLLFAIVVGGLYFGVFTATEAGAVGAFAAFSFSTLFIATRPQPHRLRRLRSGLGGAFQEAGSLTAMLFALIVGAALFTQFLVLARVPSRVSDAILALDVSPGLIVILLLLALIPLGMLIDGLSILLIVTPLAYPIVTELGYSGIWFGILLVKMTEIGLLTPPVGLNVFVVSGLFPDLRVEQVFRRIWPFVLAELLTVALFFLFPDIVLFLPELSSATP
jgi:C4-dicarboxylate transporter DctM subunit